jgi:hypothetical protein
VTLTATIGGAPGMPHTIRDKTKLLSSERLGDAVDFPARRLRGCQQNAIEAAPGRERVKKEGSDERRRDVNSQSVVFGKKALRWMIRAHAKALALIGAILILGAQLFAVAHFHQRNITRQFNAPTQVVADDGLCALCNLVFHAPFNPAAKPTIARPYTAIRNVIFAVTNLHLSAPFSSYQTRAPPAATV